VVCTTLFPSSRSQLDKAPRYIHSGYRPIPSLTERRSISSSVICISSSNSAAVESAHSETFTPLPHWSRTYAPDSKSPRRHPIAASSSSSSAAVPLVSHTYVPERVGATSHPQLQNTFPPPYKVPDSTHLPLFLHILHTAIEEHDGLLHSTPRHPPLARPDHRRALRKFRESNASLCAGFAFQSLPFSFPYLYFLHCPLFTSIRQGNQRPGPRHRHRRRNRGVVRRGAAGQVG
jgi:hypothetical protein